MLGDHERLKNLERYMNEWAHRLAVATRTKTEGFIPMDVMVSNVEQMLEYFWEMEDQRNQYSKS